jgi:hypothetical protein
MTGGGMTTGGSGGGMTGGETGGGGAGGGVETGGVAGGGAGGGVTIGGGAGGGVEGGGATGGVAGGGVGAGGVIAGGVDGAGFGMADGIPDPGSCPGSEQENVLSSNRATSPPGARVVAKVFRDPMIAPRVLFQNCDGSAPRRCGPAWALPHGQLVYSVIRATRPPPKSM